MKCPHCGEEIADEDIMPVIIATGEEFEQFLCDKINAQEGMKCEMTKASGDQGVDLIVRVADKKVAIQCKLYSEPVGNSAVQEIVAGRIMYKCDIGCVVTNSTFTNSAKELAKGTDIALLNYQDVLTFLRPMIKGNVADAEELMRQRLESESSEYEKVLLKDLNDCDESEKFEKAVLFVKWLCNQVDANNDFNPCVESLAEIIRVCHAIGSVSDDLQGAEWWIRMAGFFAERVGDRDWVANFNHAAEELFQARKVKSGYRDFDPVSFPSQIRRREVLFSVLDRALRKRLERMMNIEWCDQFERESCNYSLVHS